MTEEEPIFTNPNPITPATEQKINKFYDNPNITNILKNRRQIKSEQLEALYEEPTKSNKLEKNRQSSYTFLVVPRDKVTRVDKFETPGVGRYNLEHDTIGARTKPKPKRVFEKKDVKLINKMTSHQPAHTAEPVTQEFVENVNMPEYDYDSDEDDEEEKRFTLFNRDFDDEDGFEDALSKFRSNW
ncbi:hypothetical protein AKO1_014486 [Acrasis kona]|uniref:Uncharacterized protein n=1 Tax=Acrasis kona TaxID=1008807 RepID=A0AAW2Z3X7_9EUKA